MSNGHCRCKSGNVVVSYSEQTLDDWLYELGLRAIYEPEIPVAPTEFLLPDWLLLPQQGITKPVIIEYWGLLRENDRAAWVTERLPQYLAKKEFKESIYHELQDYHYLGILPENLDIDWLVSTLQKIGWNGESAKPPPQSFQVYQKQT